MSEKVIVVVPWHSRVQREKFEAAWGIDKFASATQVLFCQDVDQSGCALTKNRGIEEAVKGRKADIVIVLDDDCFPNKAWPVESIDYFVRLHVEKLNQKADISQFVTVTEPKSRGTPYNIPNQMPVAAVMGFWENVGDYDAPSQLVYGATHPMKFSQLAISGSYFPLSGMNLCFRPKEWFPWYQFINVARYDDIWAGWLWQKEAYRRGYCFRLDGPIVHHSRQSNVFQNLRDEAKHLEANETLWQKIAQHPSFNYEELVKLLPV